MSAPTELPALAIIVVAHQSAGVLGETLPRVREQMRPGDELVVVDNASSDGSAALARTVEGCRVVQPGRNLGFAAGAHAGVAVSSAPLLLLLNPDARPQPDCLDALRATAAQRPDWGAWQALVLLPGGAGVNTSGGVTHFLGFGWAGQHDEPVARAVAEPAEVSFASGAALVVRREAWEALGGFDPSYFMYGEDLDLSLRLWLAGWRVGVVPAARVEHDYEFAKGDWKWFRLERNRWLTVLAAYPTPLLVLLTPALALFELALLPVAARDGWLGPKLRAQRAVLRGLGRARRRRRAVQATRRVTPAAFAARLTSDLDSPFLAAAQALPALVAAQRLYWRAVLALLEAHARS